MIRERNSFEYGPRLGTGGKTYELVYAHYPILGPLLYFTRSPEASSRGNGSRLRTSTFFRDGNLSLHNTSSMALHRERSGLGLGNLIQTSATPTEDTELNCLTAYGRVLAALYISAS